MKRIKGCLITATLCSPAYQINFCPWSHLCFCATFNSQSAPFKKKKKRFRLVSKEYSVKGSPSKLLMWDSVWNHFQTVWVTMEHRILEESFLMLAQGSPQPFIVKAANIDLLQGFYCKLIYQLHSHGWLKNETKSNLKSYETMLSCLSKMSKLSFSF